MQTEITGRQLAEWLRDSKSRIRASGGQPSKDYSLRMTDRGLVMRVPFKDCNGLDDVYTILL